MDGDTGTGYCIIALILVRGVEFKAAMVLPEITRNNGNYSYGNYVNNANVENALLVNIVKMTSNDRLCHVFIAVPTVIVENF